MKNLKLMNVIRSFRPKKSVFEVDRYNTHPVSEYSVMSIPRRTKRSFYLQPTVNETPNPMSRCRDCMTQHKSVKVGCRSANCNAARLESSPPNQTKPNQTKPNTHLLIGQFGANRIKKLWLWWRLGLLLNTEGERRR
jgi:hypothetical protein